MREAIEQFRAAIHNAGLHPPEVIEPDGKLHRFASNGKRGDDAGWCKLFADCEGGVFGDFRSGMSETWQAQREKPFTPAEREAFRRRCEHERLEREAEQVRRRAEARDKARLLWKAATPARADQPYLVRKGISPVATLREIPVSEAAEVLGYTPKCGGAPLAGRLLIVPVKVGGRLATVEMIDEAGRKSALYGGAKGGGYWAAQPLQDGDGEGFTLLLGEGVATVLSAREATGYPAFAALSCGNLEPVAKAMRERYPAAALVLLADLVKATGKPDPHAIEAARAVGGLLAIPDFGEDRPEGATDFNDMATHLGLESVRACIEKAKAPQEATEGPNEEKPDVQAIIARLAMLSPIEYDRCREAEAKALGVRVATLDAEVAKLRHETSGADNGQGELLMFPQIETWPETVDGAELLDEVSETFSRYVVLPGGAADIIALWAAYAHAFEVFVHSPRLNITSPQKQCGKTLVLDVLETLLSRAQRAENLTTAVLFRVIDKYSPTLLIDEYDTFLRGNEELRGALNAGHKRGGTFLRCEGENNEVRSFRVFAPVVLAGIRALPGTLHDRSIVIPMVRAKPGEIRQAFDMRKLEKERILGCKLMRWRNDNVEVLKTIEPRMPKAAFNRIADNWRPLFAVAECVGGQWPRRALEAFDLLATPQDDDSVAIMLLEDIKTLFEERKLEQLSSQAIATALGMIEERPWPEFRNGRQITTRQIAALLKPFKIKPKQLWVGGQNERGYELEQFNEAFSRYLAKTSARPLEPLSDAAFEEFRSARNDFNLADENRPKPAPRNDPSGLADRKGGTEEREVFAL